MHRFLTRLVLAASLLVAGGRTAWAQDYVVVVNAANPAASVSRSEAANLFLKKAARWSHGAAAQPVDLQKSSAVRDAFSRAVLGKPASAIVSFWQQQIFSGRDVPPPEKASDAEVLAHVRANPGAVGYVSAGTDLGAGVKRVAVK